MDSQYAAAENPIFQSKNRFFAVSAPENPQDFSGNWRGRTKAARSARNRRSGSPMRAKEAAQPVAAIAADEPSEAGSAASELANIGGPKGWSGEHTEQSAVRSHGTPRKRQRRAVRRRGATMLN